MSLSRLLPILAVGALLGASPSLGTNPGETALVAGAGDEDEAVVQLGRELSGLLETYRWPSARWGVLVVSLDRGDTLFARNADVPLAPASNVKLLTSAAALRRLGPDFRFRTYLVSDGRVEDGVLHGDLVLYGTGDPGISDRFYPSRTWVFQRLVDQLREEGIHTVTGDLVADASFLPGPLRPVGWDPADLNDHFAAAVSALSFNENVVTVRLEPGRWAGLPPVVHTIPDHADLLVDNRAVTVDGGGDTGIYMSRDDPLEPFVVEGRIRRNARDVWRQTTVAVPARFTGSVFRRVLEDSEVTLGGDLRVVDLPGRSVVGGARVTAPTRPERPRTRILARHESPPLREYLAVVNKESNNLFAELVFRVLGRDREGVGTPEAGARAVEEVLTGLGADVSGLRQYDGSGLSEGNRMPARLFVDLLRGEAASPSWEEFWATLPEAGRRRELSRMYNTPAAGNLRAKTGTIARTSALSGVVRSAQGEPLAFSILVNGTPSPYTAKRVENAIGARLASFVRSRPPDRATQLPPPFPSDEAPGIRRHRVGPDESFSLIASRYDLTLEELLEANPGVDPERLPAGTILLIPPEPAP